MTWGTCLTILGTCTDHVCTTLLLVTVHVCTFLPRSFFWKTPLQTITSHLPLKHVQFTHQNKRFVLKQLFQSIFRVCFGPKQFVFVKQQNGVKFFIFFQQFIFFQFQTVDPCGKNKKKAAESNATLTNQDTATHSNNHPLTRAAFVSFSLVPFKRGNHSLKSRKKSRCVYEYR